MKKLWKIDQEYTSMKIVGYKLYHITENNGIGSSKTKTLGPRVSVLLGGRQDRV